MNTALTVVFYGVVYGALTVLSARELVAWSRRRTDARFAREHRCAPRPTSPRFTRDDPSPRKRAS